jgi:hypothetical protein
MGVGVRRDRRDAVALPDAERPEGRRPTVAAFEEFRVGEADLAVDDRLAIGLEASGATGEIEG